MDDFDIPVKVAFCRLLHAANGGRFTETGLPILEEGIRGTCDEPYDCAACQHMQEWLRSLSSQGYSLTWECQTCLRNTAPIWRYLPGHYQEGNCQRCGFNTPLLQLTVRKEPIPPHPWPLKEDPFK
jgi:hypothetical protein